jgi:two-component system OmpR family response regulator
VVEPDAPRVLIVDDNVEFAGLIGTLIAEQGLLPVVVHTARDGLAQLDLAPPAAMVVDLLLPDMTGHRLLEAVIRRGDPPPLYVMSGVFRGPAQQERVEAITPLAGWFEKPFETRHLVEAVVTRIGHTVKARREHKKVGEITGNFDINILEPVDFPRAPPPTARLPPPPPPATDDLDIAIEVDVEEDWNEATEAGQVPPRRRRVPTPATPFEAISTGFGRAHTQSPAEVAAGLRTNLRTGTLAETTMPRLLNAFYVAQETGEIVFERDEIRKIVYFEAGVPAYALSNLDSDRLGALARKQLGLSEDQVHQAVQLARQSDKMTGDILVELGYVDADVRVDMLAQQTRAIVRSLFTWTSGRYVVGFKVRTQVAPVPLKEDTASLVINGVRDLFELERLRKLLARELRPRPSPNSPFPLYQLPLTDPEALLLLKTTGDLNVEELCELIQPQLDERHVLAALYSLLTLGVLVGG